MRVHDSSAFVCFSSATRNPSLQAQRHIHQDPSATYQVLRSMQEKEKRHGCLASTGDTHVRKARFHQKEIQLFFSDLLAEVHGRVNAMTVAISSLTAEHQRQQLFPARGFGSINQHLATSYPLLACPARSGSAISRCWLMAPHPLMALGHTLYSLASMLALAKLAVIIRHVYCTVGGPSWSKMVIQSQGGICLFCRVLRKALFTTSLPHSPHCRERSQNSIHRA